MSLTQDTQIGFINRLEPTHTRRLIRGALNLVIFFIFIQIDLVKCTNQAARTSHSNYLQPRRAPSTVMTEGAPIFDTSSLYKPPENPTSRQKRSASSSIANQGTLVDACQSKMEVLTPYHATNSKGKLRTIVNSELMQQAIQVETCSRSSALQSGTRATNRCNAQSDCSCEQKYKWHRLLVLDPSGESGASKGLFMDWFLFPSNCVCRCKTHPASSTRHFLRTVSFKQ